MPVDEKDGPGENGDLNEGGDASIEPDRQAGPSNEVGRCDVDGQPSESQAWLRRADQLLQPARRRQQDEAPKEQAGAQVDPKGVENEVALCFEAAEHRHGARELRSIARAYTSVTKVAQETIRRQGCGGA